MANLTPFSASHAATAGRFEGPARETSANPGCTRACPVCGGRLIDIRHKLHCERCHSIVETCCEGGRG